MKKRNSYTVRVERDERGWWVALVDELPPAVTQARRLDQLDGNVAEVIELLTEQTPGQYALQWDVHVPDEVADVVEQARVRRHDAAEAEKSVAAATKRAAKSAVAAGLTTRDTGRLLGLTHQRIAQLVAS